MSFGRKEGGRKGEEREGRAKKKTSGRVCLVTWSGWEETSRLLMGALSHFGKRAAGSPDAVVGPGRLGKCVLRPSGAREWAKTTSEANTV